MARTIAEIYNSLNQVKANMQELHAFVVDNKPGNTLDNAETLLADMSNKSKVAIWRLWLWLMAVASWMVEKLFDIHKEEVEDIIAMKRPHTLRWYAEESKKFQYGYSLEWLGDTFGYSADQPASKIITYASASEVGDKVLIKVATGERPNIKPLSTTQLSAFKDYWAKWKDAGVKLEIVSLPADEIKVNMKIIRDRMILDNNNRLLRDYNINPIEDAIVSFGAGLEFDGILRISKLVDAIQAAEGVIDVQITDAWHRPSGGDWKPINMSVMPASGLFYFRHR
jgi:predicted transcriptional regulator